MINLGRWKENMSYVVIRLTRNTFWGHYANRFCERWRNEDRTRDRIKSTSKTLSLTFGHLVEYRGFIRLGPIQVHVHASTRLVRRNRIYKQLIDIY